MPSPRRTPLLTIGYEGRTADQLVAELTGSGVTVLVDVRLTPLSRKPGLSKRRLEEALRSSGITYIHLPALGNPKENRAPFRDGDPRGRSRFRARLRSAEAKAALDEVATLARSGRVALLCFEREPLTCHRHMVGEEVVRRAPALAVAHA